MREASSFCVTSRLNREEIRDRFYAVLDGIITQIKATPNDWVWGYHPSVEALKDHHIQVTERFYADYEAGKKAGRYRFGELPTLSDLDDCYELSLSSHFPFLYSTQLDADFHIAAIGEMLRVSSEARIFPLLTLAQQKSPHLERVTAYFKANGYHCQIETVGYELQPNGNEMLKICRSNAGSFG